MFNLFLDLIFVVAISVVIVLMAAAVGLLIAFLVVNLVNNVSAIVKNLWKFGHVCLDTLVHLMMSCTGKWYRESDYAKANIASIKKVWCSFEKFDVQMNLLKLKVYNKNFTSPLVAMQRRYDKKFYEDYLLIRKTFEKEKMTKMFRKYNEEVKGLSVYANLNVYRNYYRAYIRLCIFAEVPNHQTLALSEYAMLASCSPNILIETLDHPVTNLLHEYRQYSDSAEFKENPDFMLNEKFFKEHKI